MVDHFQKILEFETCVEDEDRQDLVLEIVEQVVQQGRLARADLSGDHYETLRSLTP